MKKPSPAVKTHAPSGPPTLRIFTCVLITCFFLLPVGFAALRNKRYLGTLYMLNIGVGFFATISSTAMFAAWLALAAWCAMPDPQVRKPLY